MSEVSWITQVGAIELAFGALSGWVVWIGFDTDWLKRFGVVRPHQLLRAHIDLIMMGTILIAAGLAAPDFPAPWSWFLVIGAWTNALSFVPLAFMEKKTNDFKTVAWQILTFSFVSIGTVALAVYLLTS